MAFSNATCAAAPVSPTNRHAQTLQKCIPLNTDIEVWILRQDTLEKVDLDKWWISFDDPRQNGVAIRTAGPSQHLEEYTAEQYSFDEPLTWMLLGTANFRSGNVIHDVLGEDSLLRILVASQFRQRGHGGLNSPNLMFIEELWKSLEEKKVIKKLTLPFDRVIEWATHLSSS
ncbi:hypothetical protein F5876DRAFT_80468 [Lentinula aff. lateritia]|uniref:Uncharacterized protein n=1 Tax=Lentinula aff. lateritia TaxID=2804960 RepID=A0ACC1TPV3_9AGAR|nr:hypothetical protein F5876DRAFT_80468 [Lentinula aff. lateritia]